MDINGTDKSTGAELERLSAQNAALEARLAALEPKSTPPKPDPKAERALKAERDAKEAALARHLEEIVKLTEGADVLIAELSEHLTALGVSIVDLVAQHGPLLPKDQRRFFQKSAISVQTMAAARLRTLATKGRDASFEANQPPLAETVGGHIGMVRKARQAADADLTDLL